MWIRTQNKLRLVNTEQIVDIYIDLNGTRLFARISRDDSSKFITLGEFKDKDTSLRVLDGITELIGEDKVKYINIPLGGDVDSWEGEIVRILNY